MKPIHRVRHASFGGTLTTGTCERATVIREMGVGRLTLVHRPGLAQYVIRAAREGRQQDGGGTGQSRELCLDSRVVGGESGEEELWQVHRSP